MHCRLLAAAALGFLAYVVAASVVQEALEEDSLEEVQATIRNLETKKRVLELQKMFMDLAGVLRVLGSGGTSESQSSEQILRYAEEADELLASTEAAASDEEKLAILKQGLARKQEWTARLLEVKAEIEMAQEADRSERMLQENPIIIEKHQGLLLKYDDNETDVDVDRDDEAERESDMISRTARMFQKAVREASMDLIIKVIASLSQSSPTTLSKVLNWQDKVGATALHWCAFYSTQAHAALAESFLNIPGVDARILDNHNHSACTTACMRGNAGVLARLINPPNSNGCDPLVLDPEGLNCAHRAAQRGDAETLTVLRPLLNAETIDAYDASGTEPKTALFMAVESGSVEAVRVLVDAGASKRRGRKSLDSREEYSDQTTAGLAHDKFQAYRAILHVLEEDTAFAAESKRAEL